MAPKGRLGTSPLTPQSTLGRLAVLMVPAPAPALAPPAMRRFVVCAGLTMIASGVVVVLVADQNVGVLGVLFGTSLLASVFPGNEPIAS